MAEIIPVERIEERIFLIRGQRIMLDRDLAEMYGVQTRGLNQAVRRNIRRFPPDFMFQLTEEEFDNLKSHFVTSSWGGARKRPFAFNKNGVALLSGVLNSDRAIDVNIQIMRTFTKLRQMIANHEELKRKVERMESRHDEQFQTVFHAIRQLLSDKEKPRKKIGFTAREKPATYGMEGQ